MTTFATIGAGIDQLWALREAKRALTKELEAIDKQYAELEEALLARMDTEGTSKATSRHATVTVGDSVVPRLTDWDLFTSFIHRTKMFHLVERRPSVSGCRELFEKKGMIPGIEPFTKRKLRMLSITGDTE